jgi:hypothetical protein
LLHAILFNPRLQWAALRIRRAIAPIAAIAPVTAIVPITAIVIVMATAAIVLIAPVLALFMPVIVIAMAAVPGNGSLVIVAVEIAVALVCVTIARAIMVHHIDTVARVTGIPVRVVVAITAITAAIAIVAVIIVITAIIVVAVGTSRYQEQACQQEQCSAHDSPPRDSQSVRSTLAVSALFTSGHIKNIQGIQR